MKTNIIKTILVGAILTVATTLTFAQPLPYQNGNGSTPNAGPVHGAPIDGGLSILLALGLGYGAKKLYDTRKQLEE